MIKTLVTAFAIMISSTHACANLVYSGGRSFGTSFDFSYSIETDGTLGRLTVGNIVSFVTSLRFAPVGQQQRLSFSDDDVTASGSGIFFDPLGSEAAFLMINYSTVNVEYECVNGEIALPKPTYLLSSTGSSLIEAVYFDEHEKCPIAGETFEGLDESQRASFYRSVSGPVVIGLTQAAVPEPGTLALLALGLAGLGWSRRRQSARIG